MQLLVFNEECLVSASHQLALITSLPFVHTARRSYRLGVLVKCSDWQKRVATPTTAEKFIKPSTPRGRRSRNKVSVGEPAEGSLNLSNHNVNLLFRMLTEPAVASLLQQPGRSMQGFASCGIPPGGTVGVCPHTAVHRPSLGWTDGQLKKQNLKSWVLFQWPH